MIAELRLRSNVLAMSLRPIFPSAPFRPLGRVESGRSAGARGQPVASILDVDPKRQAAFRHTMERLANLRAIEAQVAQGYDLVLTMAQIVNAMAQCLKIDTDPTAKDMLR